MSLISPRMIFRQARESSPGWSTQGPALHLRELEFFEHHFAKSGHEDLLVTRQYPDHIDIVHLHAREASAAGRLRSSRVIGNGSTTEIRMSTQSRNVRFFAR